MPVYNMAATIGRAVASVVAQSETSWELVVIDDGSTDDTAAIVSSCTDLRVSLVKQANAGVSSARNRGIGEGRARLITFLDADDHWAPGHLVNLQLLVDSFPDAVLYATAYQLIQESGHTRRRRRRAGTPVRAILADYFAESVDVEVPICSSGVAGPKSALQQVGGFPVEVRAGEDLITWSRLACFGEIAYSTEATTYVSAPALAADRREMAVRTPDRPDYVAAALAQLVEDYPQRARSIERYLAWWHRLRALAYAEVGAPLQSLGEIRKAIALDRPTIRDGMIAILSAMPRTARAHLLAQTRLRRSRLDAARYE